MNSDDSDLYDDNEEYCTKDDLEFKRLCGLAVTWIIIVHKMHNIRTPCHTSDHTRNIFINDILNESGRRCYEMFRLHVPVFRQLCFYLATNYGLKGTHHISIEE